MTLKRWDGVAFQDVGTAKRWDGASWIDLTVAKRWDGVAWIDITLPGGSGGLSAIINHANVSGDVFSFEPAPLFVGVTTSPSTVVTATGGMGAGPTYQWVRTSGSAAISPDAPTSDTTTFSATVGKNQELQATFRCDVTRGVEIVSVVVAVSLSYFTDL